MTDRGLRVDRGVPDHSLNDTGPRWIPGVLSAREAVAGFGGRFARRLMRDLAQRAKMECNPRGRGTMLAEAALCQTPTDWYRFSQRHLDVGSVQMQDEICPFLEWVTAKGPHRICEIGTAFGGTNLLLTRAIPGVRQVIGLDLWVRNKAKLRLLAAPHQLVCFIDGRSAEQNQVASVARCLGGSSLDLLFIDGDHRFEGVRADFLAYRALVRDGGLIAFHDIVPDRANGEPGSGAFSGGVPRIWQLLKQCYPTEEFVADWKDQRGFGIGVLTYSPSVSISADVLVDVART